MLILHLKDIQKDHTEEGRLGDKILILRHIKTQYYKVLLNCNSYVLYLAINLL